MELSALRKSLQHWSYLLRNGKAVKVWTDHKSLSQKVAPQPHDPVWVRDLIAAVLVFPLDVTYIRGETMGFPDLGSRSGVDP
jgi:hypothetical protein